MSKLKRAAESVGPLKASNEYLVTAVEELRRLALQVTLGFMYCVHFTSKVHVFCTVRCAVHYCKTFLFCFLDISAKAESSRYYSKITKQYFHLGLLKSRYCEPRLQLFVICDTCITIVFCCFNFDL